MNEYKNESHAVERKLGGKSLQFILYCHRERKREKMREP